MLRRFYTALDSLLVGVVLLPLITSLACWRLANSGLLNWFELPKLFSRLSAVECDQTKDPALVLLAKDWRLATLGAYRREQYGARYGNSDQEAGRGALAEVLEALCKLQPRAIVVDIEFAPGQPGSGSQALLAAIANRGDVPIVLGCSSARKLRQRAEAGGDPFAELGYGALKESLTSGARTVRLGYTEVARDRGLGYLQHKEVFLVGLVDKSIASQPAYGLAAEAVAAARGVSIRRKGGALELPAKGNQKPIVIPLDYWHSYTIISYGETPKGNASPFRRFNYWQLTENKLSDEDQRLLGRAIVFIGDATGVDRLPVPGGRELDGVEIHAHVANMIKEQAFTRFVALRWQVLVWWLLGTGSCLLVYFERWQFSLAYVAGIIGVPAFVLYAIAHRVVFVTYPALAVFVPVLLLREVCKQRVR